MGKMSELDLQAREAGLTEQQRRTLLLADVVAAAERDSAMTFVERRNPGFPVILEAAAVALLAGMADAGVPDPLAQPVMAACLLADLFSAAGCRPPDWIVATL